MPYNNCFRQHRLQFPQQRQHGGFLFHRPCVRRYAVRRQSPFIADADGVSVVVLAMRPHFLYRSATVNLTIARDIEMVSDVTETTVMYMVVAAGFEIQVPPLGGGGTMDDDKCYFTHPGRLNATLYTYGAGYSGRHCDDNFENDAPGKFSFLIFHKDKILRVIHERINKRVGGKNNSLPSTTQASGSFLVFKRSATAFPSFSARSAAACAERLATGWNSSAAKMVFKSSPGTY